MLCGSVGELTRRRAVLAPAGQQPPLQVEDADARPSLDDVHGIVRGDEEIHGHDQIRPLVQVAALGVEALDAVVLPVHGPDALFAVRPTDCGGGRTGPARRPRIPTNGAPLPRLEMRWMRCLAVAVGHVQIAGRAAHRPGGPVEGPAGRARRSRRAPRVDHFPLRTEAADRVVVGVGGVHPVLGVDPQQVGVLQQAGSPGVEIDAARGRRPAGRAGGGGPRRPGPRRSAGRSGHDAAHGAAPGAQAQPSTTS